MRAGTISGGDDREDTKPRTQHHLSFTSSNDQLFANIKSALEADKTRTFPNNASGGEKSAGLQPNDSDASAAVLKHMEAIKPINAAIRAFQKRRTKGSTSSLSSKDGRGSQSGFGSNLSLNDFYNSASNLKERSNSKDSLKKSSIKKYQPSPRSMQQKILLLDHTIEELRQNSQQQILQIESIPLEKLGDNAEIKRRREVIAKYRLKKFNSTSTLFVDSCLVNSEIEEYLK